MLIKKDAEKIANAVNALRPDWSVNGIMTVLGDTRCRNRATRDITLAFVALALDPASRKPTRIYEHGPWWEVLAPSVGSTASVRTIEDTDCATCFKPKHLHGTHAYSDHDFETKADQSRAKRRTEVEDGEVAG